MCVCVCVCACVSACVYVRACVHADRLHTYKEKERGHLLFCLIICEYKFHYFLCISLVGCGHIIRRGSSHCPAAHSEKLSLVCTRWCRKQLRSFVPNLFMTYEQSNDYVKFYDFFLTGQDGFFRGASSGGVDGGEMKKVNGCQRSMKRNFQVYTSWPRFKNKTKQNKQTNKTNKQTKKKKTRPMSNSSEILSYAERHTEPSRVCDVRPSREACAGSSVAVSQGEREHEDSVRSAWVQFLTDEKHNCGCSLRSSYTILHLYWRLRRR